MLIGIYGYMSAGKTTICEYLKNNYQFFIIDADSIAKKIINENNNVKKYLHNHYQNIIDQNNNLIKSNFRALLFSSWERNQEINNYLWPIVGKQIKQILIEKQLQNQNIVIESLSLKMLELSWTAKIFLYADFNSLIKRVSNRNHLSTELIFKILNIQTKIFANDDFTYQFDTTNGFDSVYQMLDKIIVKKGD